MAHSVNYTLNASEFHPLTTQGIEENAPQFFDCNCCSTTALATIRKQPDEATHYAAAHCQNCDRFLKWLSKPKNLSIKKLRSQLLTLILGNPRFSLTTWQRQFLTSIRDAKSLSQKQLGCLDRILLEMREAANV